MDSMQELLENIRNCQICKSNLKFGVNPVLAGSENSKIAIIGQAPGSVVHNTGIPWDDKSGKRLREWLGVTNDEFYNPNLFAIIPMGFCYPGKGGSGDLPPRKECALEWHEVLFNKMPELKLILLIGSYAQNYYLGKSMKRTLTDTVMNYGIYLPEFFVLPHPSPRNNIWMKKNAWFEQENIPVLKECVREILNKN